MNKIFQVKRISYFVTINNKIFELQRKGSIQAKAEDIKRYFNDKYYDG